MAIQFSVKPFALVLAGMCLGAKPFAQTTQTVEKIEVTTKAAPVLEPEFSSVSGFGLVRVKDLAQSVTSLSKDVLNETALSTLSQLTRLDASLTDAYNTAGYNQSLTVRGFLLDNVYNFRRDALPVLNIGPLALENKTQLDVLKGVSGMLSGISAPGGLVNTNTARARSAQEAGAQVSVGENGSVGANAFYAARAGGFGMRLDASAQQLRPEIDHAKGERQFAAAALDTSIGTTKILLDIEAQNFRQPSVPGVGLLDKNGDGVGDTLPSANARLNLNAQPWTQPFETRSTLTALKLLHPLNEHLTFNAAAQSQRVRTNDRTAFPDGCSNDATYVYPGYCGNGDYDVYDFRSDNERRTLNVLDAQLRAAYGATSFLVGAQRRTFTQRTNAQAYNYVGSGNLFAPVHALPADATLTIAGTHLDETANELYANASSKFGAFTAFGGVRAARIARESVRTDGSEATKISQTIVTPWLGGALALSREMNVYASWGQGAESEVVPNRPQQYANPGMALPTLKSTQIEIGAKWQAAPRLLLTAAAFDIRKPFGDDAVDANGLATKIAGAKKAQHRGLEFSAVGKITPQFSVQSSFAVLDATYTRNLNADLIGKRVTNVPRLASSLFVDWQMPQLQGFAVNALLSAQSKKAVTADNSVELPATMQLDLGARYAHVGAGQRVTWRLNVENVTNREGWREAPTAAWGGIYVFPTPARAVRGSVAVQW